MTDQSKVKDLAILLPLVGAVLFTPPVLFLIRPAMTIFGIPLLPLYLFFMWFLLILGSWQLSHHLTDGTETSPDKAEHDASAFPKE